MMTGVDDSIMVLRHFTVIRVVGVILEPSAVIAWILKDESIAMLQLRSKLCCWSVESKSLELLLGFL